MSIHSLIHAPTVLRVLVLACVLLPRPSASESRPPGCPPEPLPALPEALSSRFAQIPQDPLPAQLVRNSHYLVSNEDHHEHFRRALSGQGGVYVGVGSDQNYVLSGWTRPEIMILMDFDQLVVDLHRAYRVIFLEAGTPEEFLSLWEERNQGRAMALIRAAYPRERTASGVLRAYRRARKNVRARFAKLGRIYGQAGVRWFLDDSEQYAYIRGLFQSGRVFMVRGDLTAEGTVSGIAAAARTAGMPIRVFYLSNAERYFFYNDAFKASMLSLPMDGESLVLRTSARRGGHYEYIVQAGTGFQAWLRERRIGRVQQITRYRERDPLGASWVRRTPKS